MQIDISKLGYRWKGIYGAGVTYNKGDVVSKEGTVQYYTGSVFQTMAASQLNATTKNELLTPGTTQALTGAPGQALVTNTSGNTEFQYLEGRSSTAVWKLPHNKFTDCGYTGGHNHFGCIMTDGSVRMWGRENVGQLGDGLYSDRSRSTPVAAAFPPSAPPIVELYLGKDSTYAIDTEGQLWSWGHNNYGQLGRGNTTANTENNATPKLVSGKGELPADAVVTSVEVGTGYYGYYNVMCQTSDGKVYYWGSNRYCSSGIPSVPSANITSPKLVPKSEDITVVKYGCVAHYHQMSYLIDDAGLLYMAGELNSIGRMTVSSVVEEHNRWIPSETDPVSHIVMEESDTHVTAGSQYYRRYMIICTNGKIYTWGHSHANTTVLPVKVPGSYDWSATLDTRMAGKIVIDGYVSGGQYAQQVVLLDNGEIWGIGYNGHGSTGGSQTDPWRELQLGQTGSNNIQIRGGGSQYGKWGMSLDSTGVLKGWGNNATSHIGNGYLTDSDTAPRVKEALFNRTIVDWRVGGYLYAASDHLTTYILSDDGNLYSCGEGHYGMLGRDDDLEDSYCFSPVLF